MPQITEDQLRTDIQFLIDSQKISQSELSRQIEVSVSYLNKWLHQTYTGDSSSLLAKLRRWLFQHLKGSSLTAKDENRLVRIYALIDDADNPRALVDRIQKDKAVG